MHSARLEDLSKSLHPGDQSSLQASLKTHGEIRHQDGAIEMGGGVI